MARTMTPDMSAEERAQIRIERAEEQAARNAAAKSHAAAHPLSAEERASLPVIDFRVLLPTAPPAPVAVEDPECSSCGGTVDKDGDTLSYCGYSPNTCEACGACYCDGAC